MSRKAFTLIELLIVVAISGMLSALAITYSSVGRNEVALTVEASKISNLILQAKQLSLATYTGVSASCGYGVAFDIPDQTYSLFTFVPPLQSPPEPPCPPESTITGISQSEEQQYTQGTWQIAVPKGVLLKSESDSLAVVLFYPPEPSVFLSNDGSTFPEPQETLSVYLATADGENSVTIPVNPEGQVNF